MGKGRKMSRSFSIMVKKDGSLRKSRERVWDL